VSPTAYVMSLLERFGGAGKPAVLVKLINYGPLGLGIGSADMPNFPQTHHRLIIFRIVNMMRGWWLLCFFLFRLDGIVGTEEDEHQLVRRRFLYDIQPNDEPTDTNDPEADFWSSNDLDFFRAGSDIEFVRLFDESSMTSRPLRPEPEPDPLDDPEPDYRDSRDKNRSSSKGKGMSSSKSKMSSKRGRKGKKWISSKSSRSGRLRRKRKRMWSSSKSVKHNGNRRRKHKRKHMRKRRYCDTDSGSSKSESESGVSISTD